MRWSDVDFHPSSRKLRQFAVLWIVFVAAIGGWPALVHGGWSAACVCWVLGGGLGTLGLVRPQILGPIFVAWSAAAYPIGWLVSNVILSAIFFGLICPLALLFKLLGRDALQLRRSPRAATYWAVKPAATRPERYLQQF